MQQRQISGPHGEEQSAGLRLEPWAKNSGEVVYAAPMFPPERIVCLTEETVETLYLLANY